MEKSQSLLESNRSFWTNPVTVILCTTLLFFGSQLLSALVLYPLIGQISRENLQITLTVGVSLLSFIMLVSIAKIIFKLKWRHFGISLPSFKHIAILPVVAAGYLLVSVLVMVLLQNFVPGFDADQSQDIGFNNPSDLLEKVSMFISLVIITPIFEELVFRGVLFKGLRINLPFWVAAILTSLIFALVHGQWNVAADTFVLSLLLCYLVEKSGSILPAILLHALKNGLAFLLLFVVGR